MSGILPPLAPESLSQILSLIGFAGIVSALVGALLKWFFDRRTKLLEAYLGFLEAEKEFGFKYYSPIANFSRAASEALKRAQQNPSDSGSLRYSFYTVAKVLGKMFELREDTGGVIKVKSYEDEEVAIALYVRAYRALPFTRDDIALVQNQTAYKKEDFHGFKTRIGSELAQVYDKFSSWIGTKEAAEAQKYFQCLSSFLMRELNEVFKIWYVKKKPPAIAEEDLSIISKVRNDVRRTIKFD